MSVLSSVAGTSLEEVASGTDGPLWFQLYAPGGAPQAAAVVERAQRAGYGGLVVTVDTAALGNRERATCATAWSPPSASPRWRRRVSARRC